MSERATIHDKLLLGFKKADEFLTEEEEAEDSGLSIDAWKGIMIAVIFIICAVGCLIPYFFRTGKKGKYVLTIGTAFGGGVFLSAGLMHLLPEAQESFGSLTTSEYPWVELLVMVGFLLIFMIEYVIVDRSHHEMLHGHDHGDEEHHSHDEPSDITVHASDKSGDNLPASSPSGSSALGDSEEANSPQEKDKLNKLKTTDAELMAYSQMTVIILLLALSVHAFLTGFGLGCQSNLDNVIVYFISIIAHKIVEAFAMSVSIQRSPLKFKVGIIMNGVLCLMTPLGIGIGMIVLVAVGPESEAADWISAIANAISSGTFLYVSICEVIMSEFSEPFDRADKKKSKMIQWVKFIVLLVGIAIMAGLAAVL